MESVDAGVPVLPKRLIASIGVLGAIKRLGSTGTTPPAARCDVRRKGPGSPWCCHGEKSPPKNPNGKASGTSYVGIEFSTRVFF